MTRQTAALPRPAESSASPSDARWSRYLELLNSAAADILSSHDAPSLVERVFQLIAPELGLDVYFNYRLEPEGVLTLVAQGGLTPQQAAAGHTLPLGAAVCGCVARDRRPIDVCGVQASEDPLHAFIRDVGLESYACTPLLAGDRLLGTLGFGRRGPAPFRPDELQFLRTVTHYVAMAHERIRSEAVRDLLMREVDHRSRNILSVVQSVVQLTCASDPAAYRKVVIGRVHALGRAQGALASRNWEGARLEDVARSELEALAAAGQYVLDGPPMMLAAESVQPVSVILHELGTNAIKYGALGQAAGRVVLSWAAEDGARVRLTWRESLGPPVRPPARTGFGSRMIRDLSRQLGDEADLTWVPDGLVVTFVADMASGG